MARHDVLATYDYPGPKGQPRMRKLRIEDDRADKGRRFTMQVHVVGYDGAGRWIGGKDVVQRYWPLWSWKAMYQLPKLLQALRANAPTFIAEGEKDADALNRCLLAVGGGGFASTGWQGASEFTPQQAAWFRRGDGPIHIVMDNDWPGVWAGALKYRELTRAGVDPARIDLLAPPRKYNDAHDAAAVVGFSRVNLRSVGVERVERAANTYAARRRRRAEANGSDWFGWEPIKIGGRS